MVNCHISHWFRVSIQRTWRISVRRWDPQKACSSSRCSTRMASWPGNAIPTWPETPTRQLGTGSSPGEALKDGDVNNWLVVWLPFFLPINIGFLIIPIDFHIFQRGGPTTNQIMSTPDEPPPRLFFLGGEYHWSIRLSRIRWLTFEVSSRGVMGSPLKFHGDRGSLPMIHGNFATDMMEKWMARMICSAQWFIFRCWCWYFLNIDSVFVFSSVTDMPSRSF